jgi:hypothetical protein
VVRSPEVAHISEVRTALRSLSSRCHPGMADEIGLEPAPQRRAETPAGQFAAPEKARAT